MNVPALRFPEFEGEWPSNRFDEIGTIIRGASPRPRADPKFYGGDIPRLMVEDVARDGKHVTPEIDFLTEAGAEQSRLCPAGTLTVVCSGTAKTVGQPSFLSIDACIHDGFLAIKDVDPRIDPDFLFYQIEKFQTQAERLATHGGTFINLTTSILKEFRRAFPEHAEQKKITAFLGVVDAKIAALRARRDGLERYKRGLMQALFSQRLRFTKPNGSAFPDWEEKRLGEVATRSTAKNTKLEHKRVLTNSAVQGVVDQGDYFDKDIANAENLAGYYVLKKGDFVYNPRISVSAPVGPIKRNDLGDGVMSPLYTVFRFKEKDTSFYNVYFATTFWHKYMKSVANYGARHDRMAITSGDLMNMPLPYPHPDEQAKIAEALSAMDAKIAAVGDQVAKMEAFKKGLLQQMFV